MVDTKPGPGNDRGWVTVRRVLKVLGSVMLVVLLLFVAAVGLILGICTLSR